MRKLITLPKGFLDTLSEKCRTELEEKAGKFNFEEVVNSKDFFKDEYYLYNENNRGILCHYGQFAILIKRNGILFNDETIENNESYKIAELYKKSKELDELKRSLASISGSLKDVIK